MKIEDYAKYYIENSDHYLVPKDVFIELFNEMENWKKEAHQYKEVIDKAIEYIMNMLGKKIFMVIFIQLLESQWLINICN